MDDSTRIKELAVDNQRCRNDLKQLTADFAQLAEMQQATNTRLDQLQSALEVRNQTPDRQTKLSQGT